MMSLAGRPIHRNGDAPNKALPANADRIDFGAQIKYVRIRNTHASRQLEVSFDNCNTFVTIPAAATNEVHTGILEGHWFLDHLHIQSTTGGTCSYEIIATQMT
jgi:hypothetical protein